MYLIRLDDASEYMDILKWNRIEDILDKYNIKPIVGIIPNNQDKSLLSKYNKNLAFWDRAKKWQEKRWVIALHGYTHVYSSNNGGINPVNSRSEFAGIPLKEQRMKIALGVKIFQENKLKTNIFFAPSHTFDMNTLEALRLESNIRVISDTVANDVYKVGDFYFIPQQSGNVRRLPFKITTFCYHPNTMSEQDFRKLEDFISKFKNKFGKFQEIRLVDRKPSLYDKALKQSYFFMRSVRNRLRGR